MSELINDVGHFRGQAISGAVSKTKNGFPQLVLELHATDVYGDDDGEWYPDAVDGVITGYLCLFGGKGDATLAVDQVIEAFGWSGNPLLFSKLNELVKDLTSRPGGHPIGFSTKLNEYDGNTSIQVSWIRAFDAGPGQTIRECTVDELKGLDKEYARGLQAAGNKAKAAAPKPKTGPKPPTAPVVQVEAAPSTAPPATKPVASATGKSTKGKAWGRFTTANKAEATDKNGGGAGFTDEQLAEIWTATAQEVAGVAANDKQITREQWYLIQEACVAKATLAF